MVMKKSAQFFMGLLIPAFMLAGVVASPALAQDKAKDAKAAPAAKAEKGKPVIKVLVDNDKVRVTENTFKPGDEGESVLRGYRVVRYLTGGTQQHTYADGKTAKFERKTGEVSAREAETQAYKIKNVGKTTLVSYVVNIKGAK
jgi:hypothetical protein